MTELSDGDPKPYELMIHGTTSACSIAIVIAILDVFKGLLDSTMPLFFKDQSSDMIAFRT